MSNTKRYRRRRRRRNSHYGVLFFILLVLLLVVFGVVKLFGAVFFNQYSNTAMYQVRNANAVFNGKLYEPAADTAYALETDADAGAMIPVRMMNETLGTRVDWDNTTQMLTMKWKRKKVQMQIGSTEMTVGKEKTPMRAAPELKEGVSYVPLADVADAFEWQLHTVDDADGGYFIVWKSKKEFSDKQIQSLVKLATEKLGPSKTQLNAGSVLLSVDTAKVVYNGTLTTLKTSEGINASVTQDEEGVKLSMEALVSLFGGSTTYDDKKGWTANIGERVINVSKQGKLTVDGKKVTANGAAVFPSEIDKTVLVTPQAAAAIVGYEYTTLEDDVFVLTSMSIANLDTQIEMLKTNAGQLKSSLALANLPEADHYIALTFDDGPTGATEEYPEGMTAYLLDELQKRNVRATFFMCGYRLDQFNSHSSRYLAEGHELGNHTVNHKTDTWMSLSEEEVRSEIADNNEEILKYCGALPTVFRAVGGGVNDNVTKVTKELGLPIISWSVDSYDWQNKKNAEVVKRNILDNISDGSVVLMHDLYSGTIEGVLMAIDELTASDETYAFVTVSQLAELRGVTLEPGVEYSSFKVAKPAETTTSNDTQDASTNTQDATDDSQDAAA